MRMPLLKMTLLAACLLAPAAAFAADDAKNEANAKGRRILKLMGAKGLAGAAAKEVESYRGHFRRIDADGDGKLTKKEYVEDGTYGNPQMRAGIFRATDRDADDIATEKEYIENRIITDEAKAIHAKMDENGDGSLTMAEFLENTEIAAESVANDAFIMFDTDGDAKVGMVELLRVWGDIARGGDDKMNLAATAPKPPAGLSPRGPETGGRRGPPTSPLMQALDADGDGALSPREIAGAAAALTALDKNKDGRLSPEELQPPSGPGGFGPPSGTGFGPPEGGFGGPGGPGGGERGGDFSDRLRQSDANGDGRVSREEFRGPDFVFERLDPDGDGFIDVDRAPARRERLEQKDAAEK